MRNKFIYFVIIVFFLYAKSYAQNNDLSFQNNILNEKIKFNDFKGIINIGEQIKKQINKNKINVDTSYLIYLNSNLIYSYNTYEYYEKSIKLHEELKECKVCTNDKNLESFIYLISNSINAYINIEKFEEAEKTIKKAINLSKSLEESKKRVYYTIISSEARLKLRSGDIDSAEILYLNLIDEVNNNNYIEKGFQASLYSNLASLYRNSQNISKAESALLTAIKILKPVKDDYWDLYSGILIQLSSLTREKGDLNSTLELLKERLIVTKNNTKNYDLISLAYSSISSLYSEMKILDSLDKYSNLAISSIGNDIISNSLVLHTLALAYEYIDSKKSLELSRINISMINDENEYVPGAVNVYISTAKLFTNKESTNYNLDSSLLYYNKLILYSNKFPQVASTENTINILTDLSNIYIEKGYDSIALNTLLKAKNLFEINNNTNLDNEQYQRILFGLTICYKNLLDFNNASKMIDSWILSKQNLIKRDYISMISNFHKNKFINNDFEYYAMLLTNEFNHTDKQLYILYDNCLLLKNLELNNIRELKNDIDKDLYTKKLFGRYMELTTIKPNFESSIELNKIAQELFSKSKLFDNILNTNKYNSIEIKNKLKNNEVSIEIGKYNSIIDLENNKWSDQYYAILLFKDSSKPTLVKLCTENDITNLSKFNYNVQYMSNDSSSLYQYIVRPILNYIKNYKTIYISSCGILNTINLSAINIDGISFGEKFSIHNLGSTRDILLANETINDFKNVKKGIIYGGINYENNITDAKLNKISRSFDTYQERSGIEKWNYLEGTLKEADYITEISKSKGIEVTKKTGSNATEESLNDIRLIQDTFFIHIATHGFFLKPKFQNNNNEENPLNLSGLLFSNANKSWTNNFNGSNDPSDGILTANEISNLNLRKCKLAILSACETGLGKIYGNEGVFGLQRGLKLAGVTNCIISLWKVPDSQTSELFQTFYFNIFRGDDIYNAFQKAQVYMKNKYRLPYYWAGFTLLE